jgi:plasmid replication initiation protein
LTLGAKIVIVEKEVDKMAIKNDYLVQKRNILNDIRAKHMTVQELRFFSIYLAKINKNDTSTRVLRFPLEDFQKIMEYERLKIAQIKATTDSLLCQVVHLPLDTGGYTSFQLFKECTVTKNADGGWYVEIDAHDKALPLMFEFKEQYFSYKLWNALRLKSANQVRMYEILKQYEKAGERVISVQELRELLGIEKNEYPRWERFRVRVLESCQAALAEFTDISFTYAPHGRKGPGGKIVTLKFIIRKNENYVDPVTLDEFIALKKDKKDKEDAVPTRTRRDEIMELMSDACDDEFTKEQVQLLLDLVIQVVPSGITGVGIEHHDYLSRKFHELNYQSTKKKINRRFEYFRAMIQADIEDRKQ